MVDSWPSLGPKDWNKQTTYVPFKEIFPWFIIRFYFEVIQPIHWILLALKIFPNLPNIKAPKPSTPLIYTTFCPPIICLLEWLHSREENE